MNLIATAAGLAAMLTGPLSHDAIISIETSTQHFAQAAQDVGPAPSTPEVEQRIAAFWIILPD